MAGAAHEPRDPGDGDELPGPVGEEAAVQIGGSIEVAGPLPGTGGGEEAIHVDVRILPHELGRAGGEARHRHGPGVGPEDGEQGVAEREGHGGRDPLLGGGEGGDVGEGVAGEEHGGARGYHAGAGGGGAVEVRPSCKVSLSPLRLLPLCGADPDRALLFSMRRRRILGQSRGVRAMRYGFNVLRLCCGARHSAERGATTPSCTSGLLGGLG
jgi:hypothetical protein